MMERMKDLTPTIVMGVFGLVLFLLIPSQISQTSNQIVGPRFIPYLAAGVIVLSSISSIIYRLLARKEEESEEAAAVLEQPSFIKVILVIFTIVLWIILFPILGFIIVTLLATAAACFIFGDRKILRISLVSIIFSLGAYYVFSNILQIYLPEGIFF